jgi:2-polyprenyl-3-methyl-5-hydroxy-6-metoxy-1,4-benzoquinol methylase
MSEKFDGYAWESLEQTAATEYIFPAVEAWLAGVMSPPKGGVVLDAGCGNGALLGRLRGRDWRLAGLEISESGLSQARRAHPDLEIESGDLTEDLSAHRLWGKCDFVVSLEVVEHVFLPRAFAKNCFGFLKPGGRLILSTPYHGYWKNLALAVTNRMDGHFTALWDYGHIKFWSRKTLEQLLCEAGFVIEGFTGVGRVPLLWKSMVIVARRPVE